MQKELFLDLSAILFGITISTTTLNPFILVGIRQNTDIDQNTQQKKVLKFICYVVNYQEIKPYKASKAV